MSFYGLSVATSGMAAARRAIELAGHNVANANTPGYSRQRLDLAGRSSGSTMIHTGTHLQGGGVDVRSQTRVVDAFLIQRSNSERAVKGSADEVKLTLSRLESAFNEPGPNGLSAQLEAYWDAWDSVVATPDDMAARTALIQRGVAIADTFQGLTRTFDLMTADVLQRADAMAHDINGVAKQISDLNGAITAATDAGAQPNDLLDQRDELVRTLSTMIDVTTRVDARGRMDITVAGASLVSGSKSHQVDLDTSGAQAELRISNSSVPLTVKGGQMQGLLHSANTLIPNQQASLDAVATRLANAVNAVHAGNQDLQDPPQPAGQFFTATSARDFQVRPGLRADPALVGAATSGAGRFDGSGAVALAELANQAGGADDLYRSMIAQLGVNAQTANRRADLQDILTQQVDRQRETVSGVSIDEEMANLVAYQQSYQASARFLTAVDEMLNTLINGTGLVGR